jgi:hypothetical protein
LPRLKPGPISEAKANAGILRCAQDDKRKTGNRRSFDCATHDETVSHSAQDDKRKTGNRRSRELKPVSSAGGDWIAQAKAWAYLRSKGKCGDPSLRSG